MSDQVPMAKPCQLVTDHARSSHLSGDIMGLGNGLELKYPAIEEMKEFVTTIPNASLLPGCRAFNGSICRDPQGRILFAYRLEKWNAMNEVAIARLNTDLDVLDNVRVQFPVPLPEAVGVHWEDPRLAVVAGELLLIVAWVKFGTPSICRQRLFRLDPDSLQPLDEFSLPYGRAAEGHPEKNWMPFENEVGGLGLVYAQRPWQVIEHPTSKGYRTEGLNFWPHGKFLSGRTPPIAIDSVRNLAFFGGHVKHAYRGARYFFGALTFSRRAPYVILQATSEPLGWGSECSPTFLSSRPASGHPCCIYPAGTVLTGDSLLVSCGVNDSYNVILQYSLRDLLGRMSHVTLEGKQA